MQPQPELRFIRLRIPDGVDYKTITCPKLTLACIPHGVTIKGIAVEVADEEQFAEIIEKLRERFDLE